MEKRIQIHGDPLILLGFHDQNVRRVEAAFPVTIVARGDTVLVRGDDDEAVDAAALVLNELQAVAERLGRLEAADVKTVIDLARVERGMMPPKSEKAFLSDVVFSGKKGEIRAKTEGQQAYVSAVKNNDVVFAIGPAGTGKTFLAVALALSALQKEDVSRIILTRPAIEAGETLGFLPGDLMDKVDPYLRPLTDALFSMMPPERMRRLMEQRIVEIVPLAYMRGRTLNHAFVILDEAQNTTPMQMKMFLTRLGMRSKTVITGDVTQTDLPDNAESGLVQIQKILTGISGVEFVYMDKVDVVRHQLVKRIIEAYETFHTPMDKRNGLESSLDVPDEEPVS